jgi:hypothetical protein
MTFLYRTADGNAVDQPVASLSRRLIGTNGSSVHHCNGKVATGGNGRVGRCNDQRRGRRYL